MINLKKIRFETKTQPRKFKFFKLETRRKNILAYFFIYLLSGWSRMLIEQIRLKKRH